MARAGMLHRGNTGAEGSDDVQRSLELLDKVLSEFEDGSGCGPADAGAVGEGTAAAEAAATPDDDSPSLGGHQSEDDGYMSMNGRRAKFALGFRPTEEREERGGAEVEPASPPPPEEAQRLISTLLPIVSPGNTAKSSIVRGDQKHHNPIIERNEIGNGQGVTTATQTTLPKTRHQRPFGWEKGPHHVPAFQLQQPPAPPCRFASLPYGNRQLPADAANPAWLPVRERNTTMTNPLLNKRSPSLEQPKNTFPFLGISSEFIPDDKPYNEHPVTIYPGPNIQYNKQIHSPTYGASRNNALSNSYTARTSPQTADFIKIPKRENISDAEMLSPKSKVPPRTLAGSMERHREVCRGPSEDGLNSISKSRPTNGEEEHFSDDSLEDLLPPPPPVVTTPSKRNSIAWEVSLDNNDPLLTPGSTKVIGRRRRKSGDLSHSSSSSILRLDSPSDWAVDDPGADYWPPPPPHAGSTEDELISPFSDTESDQLTESDLPDINNTGTYVIRRGKTRKQLPAFTKNNSKPVKNIESAKHNSSIQSQDIDKSAYGSSVSISGISGSHNSVSSLNSRLSSDLSIPQSRFSIELNSSRVSRELLTPNSRYSVDLCTPALKLGKELTSPKSRLSLDLNNGQDKNLSQDFFNHTSKNGKTLDRSTFIINNDRNDHYIPKTVTITNKLSPQNKFTDSKKYSSTFDSIQSLIKQGVTEECPVPTDYSETISDLNTVIPNMVRVVSLPALSVDNETPVTNRQPLITTVEEEEDQESPEPNSSGETSPLRKIENNISAILSQGRDQKHFSPYMTKDWDIHKDEYCDEISNDSGLRYRERQKRHDIQKSSSHNEIPSQRSADRRERLSQRKCGISKSTSAKEVALNRQPSSSDSAASSSGDFPLNVQIVEHSYRSSTLPASPHDFGPLPQTPRPSSPSFPPLPPSPVAEDDEYSEIVQHPHTQHLPALRGRKADTLPTAFTPSNAFTPSTDPKHRSPSAPAVPSHCDGISVGTSSLRTRSMDTGFSKNKRLTHKHNTGDRKTLPGDMAASGARRRTLQRQQREATPPGRGGGGGVALQTSASLPETPIFARGCDVPRTPHRHTATGTTRLAPRQSSTMNSIQTINDRSGSGCSTLGAYGRSNTLGGSLVGPGGGVERALAGAELLRLAGGPARGWYPKQRHRPASIEHLERLSASTSAKASPEAGWEGEGGASRKPLTLPPNLTPKFFHKSPREALRRVTSLLIRKGHNGKEKESTRKDKEAMSPASRSANGDEHIGHKQRKGFFKSFWKRSRQYSLEHP